MLKRVVLFILIGLFSINSIAQESFKVVVGLSKPPYVIEEHSSGFEIELIKNLLTQIGKKPEFTFIPFGRSEKMLAQPDIHAVMTANKNIFPNLDSLSDSYISYQNVAISLKSSAVSVEKIADIANYSVASFQKADTILGDEFGLAVSQSPIFIQVANQERQVELLIQERVTIVVMDIRIFLHYLTQLGLSNKKNLIKFHHIFPKTPYSMAFKSKSDVEAFNQALIEYQSSEQYQNLLEKYDFEFDIKTK